MDIKEALVKIEQYWQIIRNLHFHIEQEGEISTEEYALIDKYLKIISKRYKDLIEEYPEAVEEKEVETIVQPVEIVDDLKNDVVQQESETQAEIQEIVSTQIDTPKKVETQAEEVVIEREIKVQEQVSINDDGSIRDKFSVKEEKLIKKKRSIATYLEEMLNSSDDIPDTPLLFPNEKIVPQTSLNERLQQTKKPIEDLNAKIKKSMSERISLNSKFEFIRELFDNKPLDYETAIQYLDSNDASAWQKVEREFGEKYNWSDKPELVDKLKNLLL